MVALAVAFLLQLLLFQLLLSLSAASYNFSSTPGCHLNLQSGA